MGIARTEAEKYLKNWANSTSKPHFAVLIEGRWGCGKTHFILSLVEDETFTERKPIYLSVFGVSDLQALETKLFYAAASTTKKVIHKGMGLLGSVFGGAFAFNTGGAVDLSKAVETATAQIEKVSKTLDGAILIIDDLERCEIPMPELLGVLNKFVEHGDTRVVLLANTEAISDNKFKSFKEKIVGHSFLLESDPEGALNSFIAEIANEDVRELLVQHAPRIQKFHNVSGYHNLRALRQFIWQLAEILEKMEGATAKTKHWLGI